MGGSSRLMRARRSLSTASNSLRVRAMMRRSDSSMTSAEPLVGDRAARITEKRQHGREYRRIRQDHRPDVASKEGGLQQRHVVPRRQEIRDRADQRRHAAQVEKK